MSSVQHEILRLKLTGKENSQHSGLEISAHVKKGNKYGFIKFLPLIKFWKLLEYHRYGVSQMLWS